MSVIEETIKPVTVISASAGTGKTSTLAKEYILGLQIDRDGRDFGAIIATTFTNKAAAELEERVRRSLFRQGMWTEAQAVLSGYLGTVNSICGRLVTEHAIENGLSPDFTVISEERLPTVFAVAVDSVIHEFVYELHDSAARLRIDNWRTDVQKVIDLARNNDVEPKQLLEFAEHSWSRLSELLPGANADESSELLDARLTEAVDAAAKQLANIIPDTLKTSKTRDFLLETDRRLKAGNELSWPEWARLGKLDKEIGKEFIAMVRPLSETASAHSRHPRLHDDLMRTIFGVFKCAAAAMQEYNEFKREHGLIDFIDQELLALAMLKEPEIRLQFEQKARILLVDEFQDTSPIQLAVFLEMAKLVDYSVWVGDEKQSIFGFRGSDPELMRQTSSKIVLESNGSRRQLTKSFRSRPSLVKFTNELFSRCAGSMRVMPESAVIEEVDRHEQEKQGIPLQLWWLEGVNQEEYMSCLAHGIERLLTDSEKWQVVDRQTSELRNIKGSDIAILCRTNNSRIATAKALSARGLTVATERDSLLDTPECVLTLAMLRAMVDDSDTLAVAEIANMLLPGDVNWLDVWLRDGKAAVMPMVPALVELLSVRRTLADRSPSEVLELAITNGGVLEAAMSWGNIRQRFANLDALRGLAVAYEELCGSAKAPATAAGLILYLYKVVSNGGAQSANPDENGINLLTYHKSKGLEWPLIILADLNSFSRGSPFGISVEASGGEINPLSPLEGRGIRYWPWPYAGQRSHILLDQKAGKTKEATIAMAQFNAESLRLLYVGMTRARDYLVFASDTHGTAWLDTLKDEDYQKILSLPLPDHDIEAELIDGIVETTARICRMPLPEQSDVQAQQAEEMFYGLNTVSLNERQKFPAYYLNPSTACSDDFEIAMGSQVELITLGARIPFTGSPDMRVLGDSVHSFLAVDQHTQSVAQRLALATDILERWQVSNIAAADLIEMSNRLNDFVKSLYPDAIWNGEFPIAGRLGKRRISGSIDLLLEVGDGFVIFDHKTFPGRSEQWAERALTYSHQMALYRYYLEQSTTKKVVAQYIHMPVVGAMLKVDSRVGISAG